MEKKINPERPELIVDKIEYDLADNDTLIKAIRDVIKSKASLEEKVEQIYEGIKDRERILNKHRMTRFEEVLIIIGFFATIIIAFWLVTVISTWLDPSQPTNWVFSNS